ncbi:sensor histidine kinase [Pseudoduganella sp. SL102]|uniref:sensor histidine kinase n=1 Tax=Pseudoduganella sp. SL102 TaxID=2995154 RepID=UPI00248BAE4B|nr:sensor histidine kinase [Pseudoduganella sp. SL102]WBS00618.1 sensor histidine kinase [Pseudoduganella sp. SL102]
MPDQPTEPRQRLRALRDTVLADWIHAVRAHVPRAAELPEPLIIDTLPAFYDKLCAAAAGERTDYRLSTLASEHGGERARLTRYDAEMVAHEFQLFRAATFAAWHRAGAALPPDVAATINGMIDEAIRESITGFVLAEAAAREQFFSALAHDIRTPLSTAAMAVEHISHIDDIAAARRLAELAAKQHARIGTMLADMLDVTLLSSKQGETLDMQALDLGALLHDVTGCSAMACGRRIDVSAEPAHGYWHRESLRRAIENLLGNAVKYSTPGTTITAALHCYGGRVALSIANAGPPIPPERVEALFQLFRRGAAGEERGWGIGLPFVRSVAERHCGSITVECRDGQTTFTLDFPIDPRPFLPARGGVAQRHP